MPVKPPIVPTVENLNYSTPTGSRSPSPARFLPVLSSQEPTQRRLEEIPFVAIDPGPDPEELSHAPTSQVPRIHDSCHIRASRNEALFRVRHCAVLQCQETYRDAVVIVQHLDRPYRNQQSCHHQTVL